MPPKLCSQVENYKNVSTAKERVAVATRLWETYIVDESERKVNVQMGCMKEIEEGMKAAKLSEDLFNTVRANVMEGCRASCAAQPRKCSSSGLSRHHSS